MEQMLLQILWLRWLILGASINLIMVFFAEANSDCDINTTIEIVEAIQKASNVVEVSRILGECDLGYGSFAFEVKRRAHKLYISGEDSELEKLKIASLVALFRLSSNYVYIEALKKEFKDSEHGVIEYCIWSYFSGIKDCSVDEIITLSKRGLAHAKWALANFSESKLSRLSLLKEAMQKGHIDAEVEYLIAAINGDDEKSTAFKKRILKIANSGLSIDSEIYCLRMLTLGESPFEKDPKLAIEFANRFLKYRNLPEYYYIIALNYFDLNDDVMFLKYMKEAAELGSEDAKLFLLD